MKRYCELVVLGALGMPGYAHSKRYYEFVENACVYLQPKVQIHTPCFSGYTAKICKLILDTLGISGYTQQKWE